MYARARRAACALCQKTLYVPLFSFSLNELRVRLSTFFTVWSRRLSNGVVVGRMESSQVVILQHHSKDESQDVMLQHSPHCETWSRLLLSPYRF